MFKALHCAPRLGEFHAKLALSGGQCPTLLTKWLQFVHSNLKRSPVKSMNQEWTATATNPHCATHVWVQYNDVTSKAREVQSVASNIIPHRSITSKGRPSLKRPENNFSAKRDPLIALYLKRNGTLTENIEAHNISGSNNSKEKYIDNWAEVRKARKGGRRIPTVVAHRKKLRWALGPLGMDCETLCVHVTCMWDMCKTPAVQLFS